jgi:O-acetyl-ADP-ribose deacetylase (regulator of RNase III)
VADQNNCKYITLPTISTGIFGFPLDTCTLIMLNATKKYLSGFTQIERVVFALFDDESFKAFEGQLKKLE